MKTTYPKTTANTKAEQTLVHQIAERAVRMAKEAGFTYDKLEASMDIAACHVNGCPLDLQKLLSAPDSDFGHDVFGIRRFLDRSTGELTQCFLPRCSK